MGLVGARRPQPVPGAWPGGDVGRVVLGDGLARAFFAGGFARDLLRAVQPAAAACAWRALIAMPVRADMAARFSLFARQARATSAQTGSSGVVMVCPWGVAGDVVGDAGGCAGSEVRAEGAACCVITNS